MSERTPANQEPNAEKNKALPWGHPLLSAAGVRERLAAYGLAPNKALGQNFLINEPLRDDMLAGIGSLPVYEIGPGLGALTEGLLREGRHVLAVEKDAAMVRILEDSFPQQTLQLRHADALKLPLAEVSQALGGGPFWVAGNLPYYITSPMLLLLLSSRLPIQGMTLMMQAEASSRFFAPPGDRVYGPLRVLASLAYHVERVALLSPYAYYPQPKISSAIVRFTGDARRIPEGFPRFLQDAFHMRRKTIYNNLLQMAYGKEEIRAALAAGGCAPESRAEALEPATLLRIFTLLSGTTG